MHLKTYKPECPHKPPDLAQRVRSLMAQTDKEHREFLPPELVPGQKTENTLKVKVTSSGSFDHLDIPYIDEDEDRTCL